MGIVLGAGYVIKPLYQCLNQDSPYGNRILEGFFKSGQFENLHQVVPVASVEAVTRTATPTTAVSTSTKVAASAAVSTNTPNRTSSAARAMPTRADVPPLPLQHRSLSYDFSWANNIPSAGVNAWTQYFDQVSPFPAVPPLIKNCLAPSNVWGASFDDGPSANTHLLLDCESQYWAI
ncbi:hypothetical protein HDU98_007559 [Podochytrium sp. JEL0797]|nr:hypothetical protein HDU98_007559 [Podochytrium sp. JEL0797]